jgi:isopentenyl phosphate kinase
MACQSDSPAPTDCIDDLVILKLGGSVITDKAAGTDGGILYETLFRIGEEIAASKRRLIIIHGAGSYGHPQAKEHRIQEGVTAKNAQGIYAVHAAVSELNAAVVFALRKAGLEAVSVHPFHAMCARNKVLCEYPVAS